MQSLVKAVLYFDNGRSFSCKSFGEEGTKVAEVIFNTSLTGYQEIATDPSYAGQFITFCMPEIGNVGVNADDNESSQIFASGVIVRAYNENYSNFRAEESLASFLKKHNAMGICEIDTRSIVTMLRNEGSQKAIMSTEEFDVNTLKTLLDQSEDMSEINFMPTVSTKEKYTHSAGVWDNAIQKYREVQGINKKVVAIDFGVKRNILNELAETGLEVEVYPWDFDENELITRFEKGEIGGIFLSNGPGDPLVLNDTLTPKLQTLMQSNIPIFAICIGHQLLSIANGFHTYKLKFGHHGGNHPIMTSEGKVEITSQNHIYNIPDNIRDKTEVIATNLFDGTIEGVKYLDKPIFSVQYHPESSPGPRDSKNSFQMFADMIEKRG